MTSAVYVAIFLHFARKIVRKISESKEEWARSLVARMEENGVKIYRDIYRDMYANMPYKVTYARRRIFTATDPENTIGNLKPAYDIITDLVKKQYPSIMANQ